MRNSKDSQYLTLVSRYFNVLLPLLALLQFQKGGPIIGFQVENEFASIGITDPKYLLFLRNLFFENEIIELLYTADAAHYLKRAAIPGVLQTANIGGEASDIMIDLTLLKALQPSQPLMTMESYTGWFDHWTEHHDDNVVNKTEFGNVLETILNSSSSINMYMFVGEYTVFQYHSPIPILTRSR